MITEEKVKTFYEKFTEGHILYDRLSYNRRYLHIQKMIRRHVKPGKNVLELGCGTGITSQYILKRRASVVGIDLSENNIRFARRFVPKGVFHVQDALTLDLKQTFDIVTLFDFMEHIPRAHHDLLFEVIRKHCHSSTTILINIPNHEATEYFRQHQPGILQVVDEEVTLDDFVRLCQHAGFSILKFQRHDIFRLRDYNELVLGMKTPWPNQPIVEGRAHFLIRKLWWLLKGPYLKMKYGQTS